MRVKHDPWNCLLLEGFLEKVVDYAMNIFSTIMQLGKKGKQILSKEFMAQGEEMEKPQRPMENDR